MGLLDGIKNIFRGRSAMTTGLHTNFLSSAVTRQEFAYERLMALYLNSQVYRNIYQVARLARELSSVPPATVKSLRNPAHTVVEFHASKLWGEDTEESFNVKDPASQKIKDAVEQVLDWSNWNAEKQAAARRYAIFGDMFLKAVEDEDKVFIEQIDPRDVTDFDKDPRGNFTYLRLDVPKAERNEEEEKEPFTRTEIWSKERADLRVWEHDKGKGATLKDLKTPDEHWLLEEDTRANGNGGKSLGIDFIPFKHAKFKDIGEDRGQGAFEHAVTDIDEANTLATRYHAFLFPDELLVAERQGSGPNNEPLPPVEIDASGVQPSTWVDVAGRKFAALPGNTTLTSMIPAINFGAHETALQGQMRFMEDMLPELKLRRMIETQFSGSGVAIKYQLSDLIDKVIEARNNGFQAVEAVVIMCFTRAQQLGLEGFDLGTFEAGKLEFSFENDEIFPATGLEKAQTDLAEMQALQLKATLFSLSTSQIRELGGIEDELPKDMVDEVLAEPDQNVPGLANTQGILAQLGQNQNLPPGAPTNPPPRTGG